MFIAHLPAGYICADVCRSRSKSKLVFLGILIGSLLPDIDMFYFYLVDNRQTHHHLYWTHIPVFWAVLYGVATAAAAGFRKRALFLLVSSVFGGCMVHLILDSPVGGVAWFFPFSKELYSWVEVPAVRSWWVWNFVLHWTFLMEVAICVAAAVLMLYRRKERKQKKEVESKCLVKEEPDS